MIMVYIKVHNKHSRAKPESDLMQCFRAQSSWISEVSRFVMEIQKAPNAKTSKMCRRSGYGKSQVMTCYIFAIKALKNVSLVYLGDSTFE